MRKIIITFLAASFPFLSGAYDINPEKTLWYDTPASIWEETVPLGDGRLGMMPSGGIFDEKIVLNDITMWSGSEADYSNPEAARWLPEIRRLLLEGNNREAQDVMYRHFVPKKPETGGTYGTYQMLADLDITYSYGPTIVSGVPHGYMRYLDLAGGYAGTEFTMPDGVTYSRIYAVPRGADAMYVYLSASEKGRLNFSCTLSRPARGKLSAVADSVLMLSGELDSGKKDVSGMKYSVQASVKASGTGASVSMQGDSLLTVEGADDAWITISAATSYIWGADYMAAAAEMLRAATVGQESAVKKGVAAHAALMNRAEISLSRNANSFLPTNRRIDRFVTDDTDTSLAALYYNYGRYLLIASTRPDLLPPNLQGLWANGVATPWNGDYHTNINVQMNHWPVESGNLAELHLPLVNLVKRAVPSGERTAKAFYGDDARGWVMHMMTNVWNYTEPGEHPSWGATNTGGAWLCRHLWDHYVYSADREYLASVYPVMKGAAVFFLSTMIEEPDNGWLVTAPSSSPENSFYMPADSTRTPVSIVMGPAMDTQIIGELWANVVAAAAILGVEDADTEALREAIGKLPPMQIDSEGRLMEWLREYEETDRHHRHVSHLYGLYPGSSISPSLTPELAEAARLTLDARGDEGTGWSRAWKVNFHARLNNGDRAWKVLRGLLQPAVDSISGRHRAGTFPNLFCSHPPFQMDGNWGGAAGIGEMLLQSHEGFINPLPALPQRLNSGALRGFRVPGGATVDLSWNDGKLASMTLTGGAVETLVVKIPEGVDSVEVEGEATAIPSDRLLHLTVPRDKRLTITAQ